MSISKFQWLRVYRIFFSVLTLLAVALQLMQSLDAHRSTVDFFSYFTIQSNLIAVGVLLWTALKPAEQCNPLSRDLLRGASVLYLSVTGIVFSLLLSGLPLVTVPFANIVLHKLMPVVIVADWLIDPPSPALSFNKAVLPLMAYPLIWLAYTIIRGALIEWYPYPFLNPAKAGGYGNIMFYIMIILLGAVFLIWLLVWIGQKTRHWSNR